MKKYSVVHGHSLSSKSSETWNQPGPAVDRTDAW